MRRMILPASLLLALSSFAMAAPIYKWVDAEGVTHFGAQPPQGAQATTVNTQTAPPPDNFPPVSYTHLRAHETLMKRGWRGGGGKKKGG
ncbi:DUF4124 domain-containing protein, partial [Pseudomonas aeruginosa]|uniref:DUF4124 domain-containing protein n=3 Tax=Pseudomonas aeruginosa TaxID=287 RepID=UPI001D0D5F9E